MNNFADFALVTESPGLKASQEQIERLYQRYHFARQFAKDEDLLEVACGSGIGLGYLAEVASKVVGIDIEEKNVDLARKYCVSGNGCQLSANRKNIEIQIMDAHSMTFSDKSFGLVLLYEAIYYLKYPQKFISEANRVLKDGGKLIICFVNKDWKDLHPSPYAYQYFSVPELYALLKSKFQEIEMYGSFRINDSGVKNKLISLIKRAAVKFNLIPGSLKARVYLKRIFMGKLIPLPAEVYEGMAPYEPPVSIPVDKINKDFKIIYAVATK